MKQYPRMQWLEGKDLTAGHPLKDFQSVYKEAARILRAGELMETKTAQKIETDKPFNLANTNEKIAFLSDINPDGKVEAYNKVEKRWFRADKHTQTSIIGEQQLYRALTDHIGTDETKLQKVYTSVTGETTIDLSSKKASETRNKFIQALELKVGAYTTLASLLLDKDSILTGGGLIAVIEGRETEYRKELINLAGNSNELQKRVTEAQKNLPANERKTFWEKVSGALGKIGLGILLGPIHYAVYTRTLGEKSPLEAKTNGENVTAKAMLRGLEAEVSIEKQNEVFKISEDWEKLLTTSVNSSFQIDLSKKGSDVTKIAQRIESFYKDTVKK